MKKAPPRINAPLRSSERDTNLNFYSIDLSQQEETHVNVNKVQCTSCIIVTYRIKTTITWYVPKLLCFIFAMYL